MFTTQPPAIQAALITASAVLGAALFAFLAAVLNARIADRNARLQARIAQRLKRAEFRQNWINDLRSSMISLTHSLHHRGEDTDSKFIESTIRIVLLMNKSDKDYEELRSSMAKMMDDPAGEGGATLVYISLCQDILKREWEVTKAELALLENETGR